MAIGVESRPTIQFNLPQPGFTIPIDNFGHVRPKSEKCIPDIPQGWQLDCSRLKDEQIQPLVNAGYIPLLPKQHSKNRGLVLPPERYLLDFGEKEVIFLWQPEKEENGNLNGSKPHLHQVLPVLYCAIGKDTNETSDNPYYVRSRKWETDGHCKNPKDLRRMEMGRNYLVIIDGLKMAGAMPLEWTWEYKVAQWTEKMHGEQKPNEYENIFGLPPADIEKETVLIPALSPEESERRKKDSQRGRIGILLDLIGYYSNQNLPRERKDEIVTALFERVVQISEE